MGIGRPVNYPGAAVVFFLSYHAAGGTERISINCIPLHHRQFQKKPPQHIESVLHSAGTDASAPSA